MKWMLLLCSLLLGRAEAAEPNGVMEWNLPALQRAMGVSADEVREYFTDGRRISFLIERRFAREVLQGRLAPSEGTPYDVIDAHGGKWEVRSLSDRGIYFCPSHMVGSSRNFDERGFMAKLDGIDGYLVSDIEQFPAVPYWVVRTATVRRWWADRKLGATSKISYAEARRLFAAMPMQALPKPP
ncbi:MAG: hypothetical protein V4709_14490 [Pseudomonadota bacterium]